MSAPDLSAFVSARFCHDLISPLGAIGNGLELLQMTGGGGSSPEIDLITDSLANALARIRFFRIAFGPAEAEVRLTVAEADEISRGMYNGRLTVSWDGAQGNMSRETGRLVFLAILCLEKSLPMGGLVRVSTAEDTISLGVQGRRTAAPAELWAHVVEGAALLDLRSENIQFAMLRKALTEADQALEVRFGETEARLRLTAKAVQTETV
jgi:histidine phosphotransferase ChpT